ncbi:MAG: ABC transporter permease [Lachnospiraceae bacterium]|nr:ABC transporter permease [Lachnospiraceae bacterium]
MWKEYSSGYLKKNRASSISVMTAAFISALLLSLLCSIFYNLWVYEIERIKTEEGDWQGRIVGEISEQDLGRIRNHANVEAAVINEDLSAGQETVIDLTFINERKIFEDLPRIAELVDGDESPAVAYHYALLNMYLIRSAEDTALRWVFPFALAVTAAACLSLVLVIHNAFAVSMSARIHQFGILSGIGATPGQIRACLLQEAFVLCAGPVLAGSLLGILVSMGMVAATNLLLADVEGRLVLPFAYHPLILCLSLLTTAVTLLVSAWIPARKMSRLTPLEAIKNTGELQLKRKKNSRLLSLLFGIEGELAGNALKAQRKAMRTAALSLVFSFLSFSFMMCFITITEVSQQETYFARYQDAWDVMVTMKDTDLQHQSDTQKLSDEIDHTWNTLQTLPGVRSCTAYQKAAARRIVTPEEISAEMLAAGGFENPPAEYVSKVSGGFVVNAPLVVLDDDSFLEYCAQIGVEPRLDGAVILNTTRDAGDPNFRKRRTLPYLKENNVTTVLIRDGLTEDELAALAAGSLETGGRQEDGTVDPDRTVGAQPDNAAILPVTAYTRTPPVLREEYGTLDFHELVHFIPLSVWKEIEAQIGGAQQEVYLRILAQEGTTPAELAKIEAQISQLLEETPDINRADGESSTGSIEIENRLREQQNNERMFTGMKAVLSVFCILLATIGIGNVFSNTLGFVRQRRREFARYLSIGLTPQGMWKIFCIEALVIAGRPVLVALPVTAFGVILFIRASYLEPMLFIKEAPFVPIAFFILAIFGFVALAYRLGAKRLLDSSLTEALRDDTML